MTPLSILVLGDTSRDEFQAARNSFARWGDVQQFPDANAACLALSKGICLPDVIVIAESFPNQFSHQDVYRLRRLAPVARVVGLLGSWCEGELRTGSPWPAVVRTYWHQWTTRCDRELGRFVAGRCTSWALPATVADEERLLLSADVRWAARQGLIVLDTPSREMHDWLSTACRSRGLSTVWERGPRSSRPDGAIAAIFERHCLSRGNSDEEAALRRLAAQIHPAPVLAMLDFPREDDFRRALAAGASFVLSKPLAIDDLFEKLERFLK